MYSIQKVFNNLWVVQNRMRTEGIIKEPQEPIALIFDLDGTILDSLNSVTVYFYTEFPQKYGVEWNKTVADEIEKQVLEMIQGKSSKILILKALNWVGNYFKFSLRKKIQFIKDLNTYYKANIKKVPLFDGAYASVKELSKRKNIITCMNTSSSMKELYQRFEEREQLLDMFNGPQITRDQVKRLKPNPDSILKIHELTKIPLSRMIMIGDMEMDIMVGKNTNILTAGVTCGHLKEDDFKKLKTDFIFKDVKELKENVNKIIERMENIK